MYCTYYYYLLLNVEEIPEIWHGLGGADREISLQGIVVDGCWVDHNTNIDKSVVKSS